MLKIITPPSLESAKSDTGDGSKFRIPMHFKFEANLITNEIVGPLAKIKYLLLLVALLFLAGIAHAQVFHSAFGFTTEVSDNWIIVSRETVSQNPDLLNFGASEMQNFDDSLKTRVKQMALAGKIELLYYKHSDVDFNDNINLFVSNNSRTDLSSALGPLCANLQAQIRQAYNRSNSTEIYHCGHSNVFSVDTINYAFDGAVIGSRSYGYLFNTKSDSITLTITCKNSKCDEIKNDTEQLFQQIRF